MPSTPISRGRMQAASVGRGCRFVPLAYQENTVTGYADTEDRPRAHPTTHRASPCSLDFEARTELCWTWTAGLDRDQLSTKHQRNPPHTSFRFPHLATALGAGEGPHGRGTGSLSDRFSCSRCLCLPCCVSVAYGAESSSNPPHPADRPDGCAGPSGR
jgi:hypothetical protein